MMTTTVFLVTCVIALLVVPEPISTFEVNCSDRTDRCLSFDGSQTLCNNQGLCKCNQCVCDQFSHYTGPTCEDCPFCPNVCERTKPCVQCSFGTGDLSPEECNARCGDRIISFVDELPEDEPDFRMCLFRDEDGCLMKYVYQARQRQEIVVQKTMECPAPLLERNAGGDVADDECGRFDFRIHVRRSYDKRIFVKRGDGISFLAILFVATVLVSLTAFNITPINNHVHFQKNTNNTSMSTSTFVSDPNKPVICHTFSSGRLGNRLFKYASILGIADTSNKTFFFTNDGGLGQVLKHPPVQTDLKQMKQRCRSAIRLRNSWNARFDRKLIDLEPGRDNYIGDFLQSWLYFDGIKEDIRLAVTFNDIIVRDAKRVVEDIRKRFPRTTLVGVHVRRGDITHASFLRVGYLTAPLEYLNKSMTYFRLRFNPVTFVVLGNDRKWSMQNIPAVNGDTVFPAPGSSPVDMEILSRTDHLVRSVGTFSWWAAFKMPGRPTVVYLKDFVKPKSVMSAKYSDNAQDYMLPRWISM